jgi:hypothetical protein
MLASLAVGNDVIVAMPVLIVNLPKWVKRLARKGTHEDR